MWTSKIIWLSNWFFHFNCIYDSKTNIISSSWLDVGIHSFNNKVHSIEHFHLHTPFSGDSWVWLYVIEHISWSDNGNIWVDGFYFLFTNPFCSKSHALRVWISSSCWNMNKSFNIWVLSNWSSNCHWDSNVRIFKFFFSLGKNFVTYTINYSILVSNNEINFWLFGEILQFNVSFMSHICSWFCFF